MALVLAGIRTLVLPFENLAENPTQDWRGSAFEESISSHLESMGMDVVDVASRNRQLREKGFVPEEAVTRASAIVLAKDLGCDRLILGTFHPGSEGDEKRIDVTARLVDLNKGTTLGVVQDHGSTDSFLRLTNQVAKNILRLERDDAPAAFDTEAERREKILPEALEASARARLSFDAEEKERLLKRAIEKSPEYLEARLELGRLLLQDGRAREAIDVLVLAKGEGLLYRRAYFSLGLAYLAAAEPSLAFDVYQSLSEGSENPAVFNNLGVALMRLDRFLEATEAFEHAIDLGGETKALVFNLGWSHWRAGKGAAALELFQKLVTADPVDAEARFMLSAAAASQAKPDLAERSRESALVLNPQLAKVNPATVQGWERSMVSSESGGSLAWASEPFELDEDVVALEELFDARELRRLGRNDDAIQLLQKSLYRDPNALDSRRELAAVYQEMGALDEAASELSILLWSEPSAEAHVQLARVYMEMQEPAKAMAELDKALALDPEHPEARGLRAEMLVP